VGGVTRPTILLDVDGPLALFTESYLDAYYRETGDVVDPDEIDRWSVHECPWFVDKALAMGITPHGLRERVDAHVKQPDFCSLIKPRAEAIPAVSYLREVADVYVVTSPWTSSPTWTYERTRWVERYFGISSSHIIHAATKHLVAGDVFVDDRPSHVTAWGEQWPNGFALLFDAPHNRDAAGLTRVDWDDVLEVARALVERRVA